MSAPSTTTSLQIRQITAAETFAVRHPVLRVGKPEESCAMPGDDAEDTLHFGLFDAERLIGVVSLMNNSKPQFTGKQYQLRGMAVLAEYQGQKLGNLLVDEAEKHLQNQGVELLWCNARIKALNFYLRKGFNIEGEPFEIENVGTHYLLFKKL
ncbi:GNAT family N-acetyltransferase [Leeuwenhoekiella sp. H156]|uniref:GNAT family N-acetyltransferase n=1 Tax=Leeuwenhoekiella sp. H156 TaxID=3450128 RepID=UPI003FA49C17